MFGVQRVMRATLPVLRAKRAGLVINVGSILGRVTLPFFGLYGASKYAVEAMSDSYRYELVPVGSGCRACPAKRLSHEHVRCRAAAS